MDAMKPINDGNDHNRGFMMNLTANMKKTGYMFFLSGWMGTAITLSIWGGEFRGIGFCMLAGGIGAVIGQACGKTSN